MPPGARTQVASSTSRLSQYSLSQRVTGQIGHTEQDDIDVTMPSAASPNPRAGSAPPDDLDALFNYDDAVEDFLKDLPLDKHSTHAAPQESTKNIDEEVIVKKKRKPVPKLDESRLLSEAGIPRLRKITKSRLKFRGKGHEYSDISGLLNTYQLWLDDLYPRAKFRDALTMVEKLGHSKRVQITRKAWLDATKPHQREASPERVEDVEMSGALPNTEVERERSTRIAETEDAQSDSSPNQLVARGGVREETFDDAPEEDELDALLAEDSTAAPERPHMNGVKPRGPFEEEDEPDDDELDALLAEEPSTGRTDATATIQGRANVATDISAAMEDDFADEEEAMASICDVW